MAKKPPEPPVKISTTLLQRKLKITFEMASLIVDLIKDKELDDGWHESIHKIPSHTEETLILGKPLNRPLDDMDHYIAILDYRCGWKDKVTGESLYVSKWMHLPKEGQNISNEEQKEELRFDMSKYTSNTSKPHGD